MGELSKSEQEIWDSYEWLIRERMEQLDYLIRRARGDMQVVSRRHSVDINASMQKSVTELWHDVAAIGTKKDIAKVGKKRAFDTTNIFRGDCDAVCWD